MGPNSLNLTIAYIRFFKGRQAVTGTTWATFTGINFANMEGSRGQNFLLRHAFELVRGQSQEQPATSLQETRHYKFRFSIQKCIYVFSRRDIVWTTFLAPAAESIAQNEWWTLQHFVSASAISCLRQLFAEKSPIHKMSS